MLTRIAALQGNPITRISPTNDALFLTFDDGPEPGATEHVMKALRKSSARATFFVIADKARRNPSLVRELVAEGHAIGNHSLDHRYGAFFRGRNAMRLWIQRSEDELNSITGAPTVGFRPPAGVVTPELVWALRELGLPLVLWSRRFFDTAIAWSERRALASLRTTRPGSIVLLHD